MDLPFRDADHFDDGEIHVVFAGKTDPAGAAEEGTRRAAERRRRHDAPSVPVPADVDLAYPQQVHSDRVVPAVPGPCGEADGVWTERQDLALAVVTADCVPVLLGDGRRVAAVHAGWRGLAAGIVQRAAGKFSEPASAVAWIGPAIGVDAYEVGDEVARQVAAVTDASVVVEDGYKKAHLDLRRAAEVQLQGAGIEEIRHVDLCTHDDDRLWSYRRDGDRAGRNVSAIWLRLADEETA